MKSFASRIVVPIAVIIAGGLVAAYLIGTRPQARPNPPSEKVRPVRVVSARFETIRPDLLLYGEIVSGREAEIRSMVAGRLVYLDSGYRSGAYVQEGDRLAAVDPFDYEIAVRQQLAELNEARAKLRELQTELDAERRLLALLGEQIELRQRDTDRVLNLVERSQTSEKAYDDAKLALNTARQQRLRGEQTVKTLAARIEQQRAVVERKQAELDRAERSLADTNIAAPFSGFLQDIAVATGKRVAVGESIGRLIDADGLEIRFELANADYSRLVGAAAMSLDSISHPLAETEVRVFWRLGTTAYTYVAFIERGGAEIDSTSGGVVLYARITDGPIGILRPGAFVEVSLPDVSYEDVIVLPATAVSDDGIVYVVEDSRLAARQVNVVRKFGGKIFIKADIPASTAIVAEQFPAIGPGILVRPM
ncbi:MAG TPA: efflux RND transporter periplasmic adaptor subunit [Gammaproteobacteria bacterium]|jgi:RND family efflux transporter MFP subunit|nr:efflux RND transporter periplasmic adaptor subunit [Gammaproteobacteria bacterium]